MLQKKKGRGKETGKKRRAGKRKQRGLKEWGKRTKLKEKPRSETAEKQKRKINKNGTAKRAKQLSEAYREA